MVELEQALTPRAPNDLFGFLDYYLVTRAPFQLPGNVKEWVVRYGPWITAVVLVLMLPAAFLMVGLGAVAAPFLGIGHAASYGVLGFGMLIRFALTAAAVPGLFARKMSAWKLVFYAQIVHVIFSLLAGEIVSAVVVGVLSMYVLFQVRPLYNTSTDPAGGAARP
jgi:hypothetical protein